MERITVAAADLIPGDIVISKGWEVNGYPHGGPTLPGTVVPFDFDGVNIGFYYPDPESPLNILR